MATNGFTGDDAVDPMPPEFTLPPVQRMIMGMWSIDAPDGRKRWLWQVNVEDPTWPSEYLLAAPGFSSLDEGAYEFFETRADALRSLDMVVTD